MNQTPTSKLKYYNPKEAAEILSTSAQRLANLRHNGWGPAYSKIGNAIRYSSQDIQAYMDYKRVIPGGRK